MSEERIAITADRGVTLPLVKILTGRGFVTGKSGSGKSNSVNVIVEETLDLGRPLLIIDTDGEYWGLKEQYRMLHLGNDERCDATVSAADADTIVELALEREVPVILDISGFLREEDADDVVHRVVKRLFQQEKEHRKPFLLIAEEVHEYIPEQGGLTDAGETLIQVAKRGRKHGLGFIGVSQRPASVDKDFITQCDWITWHRLTWKNDTDVVRSLLGSDAAEEVEELAPGEGILMTDWDEQVQQIQFRKKRTYDAGQTPGFGEFDPPELVPVEAELLERFGVDAEDVETAQPTEKGRADSGDADADEQAVAETQTAEDGPESEVAGAADTPAVDTGSETPAVVEAEPVEADGNGTDLEARRSGDRTSHPRRAKPTSGRGRRRNPPRDRPEIVEFGEMVIYLSGRFASKVSGGVSRITSSVGSLALSPWADGNVDREDVVVAGWLLLVVIAILILAIVLAVAI